MLAVEILVIFKGVNLGVDRSIAELQNVMEVMSTTKMLSTLIFIALLCALKFAVVFFHVIAGNKYFHRPIITYQ